MSIFDDIRVVAESLFGNGPAVLVWISVIFIIFVIACLKVAVEFYKESKKGFTFSSFLEIAKPILHAYLAISVIPFLTGVFITVVGLLFNEIVGDTAFDNGNDDIVAERELIEEVYNIDAILVRDNDNIFGGIRSDFIEREKKLAVLPYILAEEINEYLFVFAVSSYFLWFVIVQIFAPFGGAGFIFKELKTYSESWQKNYLAANIYLAAIVLSNGISLGVYNIYRTSGEYNFLVHIIFLIILLAFLYTRSFAIASKII